MFNNESSVLMSQDLAELRKYMIESYLYQLRKKPH